MVDVGEVAEVQEIVTDRRARRPGPAGTREDRLIFLRARGVARRNRSARNRTPPSSADRASECPSSTPHQLRQPWSRPSDAANLPIKKHRVRSPHSSSLERSLPVEVRVARRFSGRSTKPSGARLRLTLRVKVAHPVRHPPPMSRGPQTDRALRRPRRRRRPHGSVRRLRDAGQIRGCRRRAPGGAVGGRDLRRHPHGRALVPGPRSSRALVDSVVTNWVGKLQASGAPSTPPRSTRAARSWTT